ncbi:MAG: hypothetical protein ABIZ34_04335 [Candidatus Limnocylindrales bacterium]
MRSRHLFAATAAVVLTVTACGGSSPAPSLATVSPTTSAAATATPVPSIVATATPTSSPVPTEGVTNEPVTSPTPATGDIDLCSLLTAADVTTVLGGGWVEGVMANDYCHWDSGSSPSDQVVTFVQPGTIETFNIDGAIALAPGGHTAYTHRDAEFHLQTTWIDIGGGTVLIVEFPTTSDASADVESATQLSEIAVGNM